MSGLNHFTLAHSGPQSSLHTLPAPVTGIGQAMFVTTWFATPLLAGLSPARLAALHGALKERFLVFLAK